MSWGRAKLHAKVNLLSGCSCNCVGTFFVEDSVDGTLRNLAIEVFELNGHPSSRYAFAWGWGFGADAGCEVVLQAASVHSPYDALRTAIQGRERRPAIMLKLSREGFRQSVSKIPA